MNIEDKLRSGRQSQPDLSVTTLTSDDEEGKRIQKQVSWIVSLAGFE